MTGFNSSLSRDGELLYFRVEEDVEGLSRLGVDVVAGHDVELLEEDLVGGLASARLIRMSVGPDTMIL
ncbi:MAG: hypothetical protein LKI24_16400 [Acidipropionibacterium sp.]|jgi:hypothetical protein|nr:hypothetical protein [Acidipropionibacterium sp.]